MRIHFSLRLISGDSVLSECCRRLLSRDSQLHGGSFLGHGNSIQANKYSPLGIIPLIRKWNPSAVLLVVILAWINSVQGVSFNIGREHVVLKCNEAGFPRLIDFNANGPIVLKPNMSLGIATSLHALPFLINRMCAFFSTKSMFSAGRNPSGLMLAPAGSSGSPFQGVAANGLFSPAITSNIPHPAYAATLLSMRSGWRKNQKVIKLLPTKVFKLSHG